MLKVLITALLVAAVPLAATQPLLAQQNAAPKTTTQNGPDWTRVQSLAPGTRLRIQSANHKTTCNFVSADADAVTCLPGGTTSAGTPNAAVVFPRATIQVLKQSHRGRSAIIGAAPGTVLAAGGGVGLATENCSGQLLCGVGPGVFLIFGVLLAGVGALIGGLTDFTASTLYRNP